MLVLGADTFAAHTNIETMETGERVRLFKVVSHSGKRWDSLFDLFVDKVHGTITDIEGERGYRQYAVVAFSGVKEKMHVPVECLVHVRK